MTENNNTVPREPTETTLTSASQPAGWSPIGKPDSVRFDQEVLFWKSEWVDLDFNPKGTQIGYFQEGEPGEECFVVARYCSTHESYETDYLTDPADWPTHWCAIPASLGDAPQPISVVEPVGYISPEAAACLNMTGGTSLYRHATPIACVPVYAQSSAGNDAQPALHEIRAIVDCWFAPWGAGKAARWEDISNDRPFEPNEPLEMIRDILARQAPASEGV